MKQASVLLVEDHAVLAEGMALVLRQEGYDVAVSGLEDSESVLDLAAERSPAVVILDLHLEGAIGDSLPLIPVLRAGGAEVLVLTAERDAAQLGACIEAGASGLAAKSDPLEDVLALVERSLAGGELIPVQRREELLGALRASRRSRAERDAPFDRLTRREQDVLAALVRGRAAEEVARESVVSIATVRSQIRAILQKLGVSSQLQAVALAREAGWSGGGPSDTP